MYQEICLLLKRIIFPFYTSIKSLLNHSPDNNIHHRLSYGHRHILYMDFGHCHSIFWRCSHLPSFLSRSLCRFRSISSPLRDLPLLSSSSSSIIFSALAASSSHQFPFHVAAAAEELPPTQLLSCTHLLGHAWESHHTFPTSWKAIVVLPVTTTSRLITISSTYHHLPSTSLRLHGPSSLPCQHHGACPSTTALGLSVISSEVWAYINFL